MSNAISAASRLKRSNRYQGGICFYCPRILTLDNVTRDHFLPKWDGFLLVGNTVYACYQCNTRKGGRYPTGEEVFKFKCLYPDRLRLPRRIFRYPRPERPVIAKPTPERRKLNHPPLNDTVMTWVNDGTGKLVRIMNEKHYHFMMQPYFVYETNFKENER